jgi:hypothetical protein
VYNGHDRTFFLASWGSFRGIAGSTNLGVIPTALGRSGNFSQSDASRKPILLKDPLASGSCTATNAAACFPGNVIPGSRISPIGKQFAAELPASQHVGANNYRVNSNASDMWDSFLFKLK